MEAGELEVRPAVATRQVAGLVAEWRFDDASDPGRDSSGNGFALVLARAPADLDGWTWRDATGLPAAGTVIRFAVEGDALVAHVLRAGTLLLVR